MSGQEWQEVRGVGVERLRRASHLGEWVSVHGDELAALLAVVDAATAGGDSSTIRRASADRRSIPFLDELEVECTVSLKESPPVSQTHGDGDAAAAASAVVSDARGRQESVRAGQPGSPQYRAPGPAPSVDRERVRQDAEAVVPLPPGTNQGKLAGHCLALLAELEQAEREAREAQTELRKREDFFEARLARVPELVEALRATRLDIVNVAREGQGWRERGGRGLDALMRIDAALAEWEQAGRDESGQTGDEAAALVATLRRVRVDIKRRLHGDNIANAPFDEDLDLAVAAIDNTLAAWDAE